MSTKFSRPDLTASCLLSDRLNRLCDKQSKEKKAGGGGGGGGGAGRWGERLSKRAPFTVLKKKKKKGE